MSSRKRSSDTSVVSGGSSFLYDDVVMDSKREGSKGDTNTTNDHSDDTNITPSKLLSSSSSSSSSSRAVPRPKLKVRIRKFHAVARWTWDVGRGEEDEVCGICQTAFEGCPPGVKYPGDESPVVFGVCGHAFHLQCIATWLSSSRNTCPICRADWEYGQSGDQQQQQRRQQQQTTTTATSVAAVGEVPTAGVPTATNNSLPGPNNNSDTLTGPTEDDSF